MIVKKETTIVFEKPDGERASYEFTLLPGRKHRHANAATLVTIEQVYRVLRVEGFRKRRLVGELGG